jgi:hypothetical protein
LSSIATIKEDEKTSRRNAWQETTKERAQQGNKSKKTLTFELASFWAKTGLVTTTNINNIILCFVNVMVGL